MTARDDRASAILVALPFARLFPEADGTITAADRQQLALLYRPIPVGAAIPVTPVEVVNTSIDNWFVIDYTQRRTRPINAFEWRVLRNLFEVWTRSRKLAIRNERLNAALSRKFGKGLEPRMRKPGDLYARRTPTSHAGDVRAGVRARDGGRASARGPGRDIRARPRVQGRH